MQTDGRTGMIKLIVAFRSFANTSNKGTSLLARQTIRQKQIKTCHLLQEVCHSSIRKQKFSIVICMFQNIGSINLSLSNINVLII